MFIDTQVIIGGEKMKNTKKSLIASGISLAVSVALLVGSTFAWFTDNVVNKGNKIQAGSLKIGAYAYDLDMDGTGESFTVADVNGGNAFTFEADPQDLRTDGTAIINDTDWEPGKSNAKLLKVVNDGTLAAEIKLDFKTSGELTNALWFDFVKVENGAVAGNFEKRPMSTLSAVAQALELPMINTGDTLQFILVYGMYEEAGNEYMEDSFTADVTILAKQYTYEEDGFGSSDYDAGAEYDVVETGNAELFEQAVAEGKSVRLTNDIVLTDVVEFNNDAFVDMNGNDITVNDGAGSLKAMNGQTLTVYGNGTLYGALVAEQNAGLVINADDDFTIESKFVTGAAISTGLNTVLEINGGNYTSLVKGGGAVINFMGTDLTIRNASVVIGVDSVVNSMGINGANAKTATLENVTVDAKYSTALNLNNADGNYVIRGCKFSTTMKAEGMNVNPTIKYQGTLDISDTVIERIGTGIKYNKPVYPPPTEPEGLTLNNVQFIAVEGATGTDT